MDQYNNHQQGLAWPSLFWAMVAVALNTMSQPSGKTLGFPIRYSFLLRSSPFVCGAHVLYTIMRLGYLAIEIRTTGANVNVLAVLMAERFEGAGTTDGFVPARKVVAIISVLFAMGASLQAVKLFAVTGIPLVHACCALYLASFLLDLHLLLGAPKSSGDAPDYRPTHLARRTADRAIYLFSAIAVVGNALFVSGTLLAFTYEKFSELLESVRGIRITALLSAIVCSHVFFIACSMLFASGHRNWISFPNNTRTTPLVSLSLCALSGPCLALALWSLVDLALIELVAIIAGSIGWNAFVLHILWDGSRWSNNVFVFSFAGLRLLRAIRWCAVEYDPLSTTKPSWVDYLG